MKWEVVDDSLRAPDQLDEVAELLLQDKTVHVTGITNADLSAWYSRFMLRHQRKLRRRLKDRDPSEGYIVWLAPASETEAGSTDT